MSDTNSVMEYSQSVADQEKPKPLPARQYRAECRGAEFKVSGKGKRYAALSLYISPDQYPADYTDGNPEGTTMTWGRTSGEDTPTGRYSMKKLHETFGLPVPKTTVDLNQFLGRTVLIDIKHELFQEEWNAQIAKMTKL